jgi:Fur family ferric uptake transcriptional regulator
MTGEQAIEELERALQRKGLKTTAQRRLITEVFFDPQFRQDHPTVDTLYRQVKSRDQSVGFATVYRTMKLLVECGLASPRQLHDNQTRYEPESPGEHHDHLICLDCGHIFEFENEEIEALQAREAARHGFVVAEHRMVLYGRCQRDPCERRAAAPPAPVEPSA